MDIKNYEKITIDDNQEFYLFSFKTNDVNRIIPMHFHQELEVIYCVSGEMKIWVGGEIIFLYPGEFYVINSLFPHSTQSHEPSEVIVFYFRPNLFSDVEARICLSERKNKVDDYQKEVALIKQIFKSTKETDPYIIFRQRSLLNEFIYILLKEFSTLEKINQRVQMRNQKVKEIISLVETNYSKQLTLNDLATLSGYTPTYLSRMFKESIGQTFSEYRKSLCVEHAINMIENTNLTLEIIAHESGFPNEKSLRTAFKETMKMTPREYLKQIKDKF